MIGAAIHIIDVDRIFLATNPGIDDFLILGRRIAFDRWQGAKAPDAPSSERRAQATGGDLIPWTAAIAVDQVSATAPSVACGATA